MKIPISVPIFLICSAFFLQAVRAKELTDADREALLENLEKLKSSYESKAEGRAGTAIATFRSAMGSEDAAVALYLKCVEKVEFTDQKKRPSEFLDWKRGEGARLSKPGFSLALRHQLRWLILTLQASAGKANRVKIATEAQDAMDSICGDFAKLQFHQDVLNTPVSGTVFAKAYDLGQLSVPNWTQAAATPTAQAYAPLWPQVPTDLSNIYNQVILPPFRKPATLGLLKTGWAKYIQQVIAKQAAASSADPNGREGKKNTPPSEAKIAEHQRFMEREVPSLQWQMEADLFHSGDPDGALVRMMAHLEKHTTHPSCPDWYQQYKNLLKPAAETPQSRVSPPPAPETADEDSP